MELTAKFDRESFLHFWTFLRATFNNEQYHK